MRLHFHLILLILASPLWKAKLSQMKQQMNGVIMHHYLVYHYILIVGIITIGMGPINKIAR